MTTNIYEPGDIVWVKLSNSWWPGEVWDPNQVPDDLSSLKKEPIAVVKFFKEDSYEYVKNSTSIYQYNCHRKKDFIKKGLELHRTSNNSFSQKFREDIVRAERLTGGDINILENNEKKMSVSKRSNIVKMIFGDQSSSNQKKTQQQKSQQTNIIEKSPKIISKLKGRSIVTVKNIIKPSMPTVSNTNSSPHKQSNSNPSTPANGIYKCHLCPFTSMRQNVIILHSKSHLNQSGSSLNSTISPRLTSENSRFSIPMPISNISKDSSVIVIDDDSDSDNLSRTQTPQTIVTTIDTSSDSQIIDVSLSPQESSSSSSSGIKTIAAQKILPSRTNIGGSDKKKKNRGNKSVNNFYVSTPIKTSNINEIAENNEVIKPKSDHIPLIKPPKKQFRKGILKDIYEDWSDEDSTPNNVKGTANKDDVDESPNNEVLQNNKNLFEALGCSRLDESDVEVLKNLQHAERNDKGKSPVTTQKIRNIPKKDRQRNIVLEDFSDSSSNVTPNQNIILENREILPSSSVPLSIEKLDNANNTNLLNTEIIEENKNIKIVQEAEKIMTDNENNSSELECKTDNLNECTVISSQNEITACEDHSESLNVICEEPNDSVILEVNISKNIEITDKENNEENVNGKQVEEAVQNNENIETILPETSNFNEKENIQICNLVNEKCSENDQIESPEFEPIDDAQKIILSKTQSEEPEESVLIEKLSEIVQVEEFSTKVNDEANLESLATEETYLKEPSIITDEICKNPDQTQLENNEEVNKNLIEDCNNLDSVKDSVTSEEIENVLSKAIIKQSEKLSPDTIDKTTIEKDNIAENLNEVVEKENEELLNEKIPENICETDITQDNTSEELNVNISEEKNSEMQKPHGRSKRSVAQANKNIGHKIRKSSRKSDNIYKYLGREITTPSPIVTAESPSYTKLETTLDDLNESCNTTISIQFTEIPSELNREEIKSNEQEKLISEEKELNMEHIKNRDEDNIEKIDKDIEEKTNRKNRKKQKVETVEKKQTSDSDKFIEFLENEIKTTPCINNLDNSKENINETLEQEKFDIDTENPLVQEKPIGRTLRERKIRKEYAELDEDSLSTEEKFEKQITDVENNSNIENKFEKSKEVDGSNNPTKISIKLKKSLLKHNKTCKNLISEPKPSTLQDEREVIPKLIIKSSKESGKEVTLKVMTVTHQRAINENTTITEQSHSESETKAIIDKHSPKSPKKSPKKSYIKQKPNDRKLFKKESPEKQKCEKIYKEDTPAAVFDFQEEDDTELVLTSLSKLKKKYMSPDKIKEPILLPDPEKQKEMEKKDEKLKAEIENLLNDTKIPDVSLTKGSEKNIESIPINNNAHCSNLNDEVKTLPIKERGKRFFKSRNVSRNEDSQSQSSICISGTSSSEKSNISELLTSNVESENSKTENIFEVPKKEEPKPTDKILKENKRRQRKTSEETTNFTKTSDKNSEQSDLLNSNNIDENIKSNSSSITQEVICNNTNKPGQGIAKINLLSTEISELNKNPSNMELETSKDNHEIIVDKFHLNQDQNEDITLSELKSDNSNSLQHEKLQKSHLFEIPKTESNILPLDKNMVPLPEIKTELVETEVANQDENISDIKISPTIESNEKTTQNNSTLLSGNNIIRRRRSHLKVTPRKRSIPEVSIVNETCLEESESKIVKFVETPIDEGNVNEQNIEKSPLTTLSTDVNNSNEHKDISIIGNCLHQEEFQELEKHLDIKTGDKKIKEFLEEAVEFQPAVNEEHNENLFSQENNNIDPNNVNDSKTTDYVGKDLCDSISKVSKVDTVNETSSNKHQKEVVKDDHAKKQSEHYETNNQESLVLLTKNLKENHLSQNFEEQKANEISNNCLNEALTKTKTSISNERKREKSITEQYEENFVEKYMKDAGISNLSSPNPQTKPDHSSDLDNIVLDSLRSSNSNENKEQKLEINTESLNDIMEKTKEPENVEILRNTQKKTNLPNTYEIPLIEQAKAIVAKIPSTQSLSDIRSFRPKRKHSSRQSSVSVSENIIISDILSPQSPTVLPTKNCNTKHLMEEKDIENQNVNNLNDETIPGCTESENNVGDNENKIPTCPDFKILKAVDKLAEVQQSTNSASGNARITVDSENPLSVQIANILASNSDFKTPTETELESKSILNISPNEPILNKKRKLSFEEDIPTFIIDKTAVPNTSNDKTKESSIKQQLIKKTNDGNKIENVTKLLISHNSLDEKEKNLPQHGIISNMEEVVSDETSSVCLKIRDISQSSNENLSSSNPISTTASDTSTTENVFDISNLPILLTTNEEILQDNIQFVITQESTLVQEDQQDATQIISANTLQEAVTEQILVPTAKKIRGRPRKSDPSLPQATSSIATGYNQSSTNSVVSPKLPIKATQQISLNSKTTSNQKGLVRKTQQNIASPTLSQTTVENSNQTYNVKATSSRELGVDASGNSIVLIQYGRNNQKLMKMPKTPTEQLQAATSMDITLAKEQITKTSEKSQKPIQQLQNQTQKTQQQLQTKNLSHHRSGQVILSNKVQTSENVSQSTSVSQSGTSYLNIANKPTNSNEVIITPIYESGNAAQKSTQQQLPQVQQPAIPQNSKAKKSHMQRTTYVGSENSEIIIRQIQQQQHEQQQQKHLQITSSTQRGRKRKDMEPSITATNQNVNTPQRNKQQKLYQSNTNKIPTHNQTTTSSSTFPYDNSKTQMLTQIDSTPSAINNQPKNQQQSPVQQQQQHLQQQQQLLQQQQNSQQTQQQQMQQNKSMIEEEIAANKIMAVPANHFGIPGSAYYLCSQDNEGNYMPIDNQELYLDPESNQLVPLSVLNAKTTAAVVAAAAAQSSTGLIDGNQQLNLIEANTDEGTSICMEISDSNKQHENNSDNNNIASTENVEAQQFIQTNNLAELSNILGPDQSICINIDGQQLILDQQSFLALVAAGGENTQLETQDGQILQLTSEFLAALGIGVSNNDNVSSESVPGGGNGGDENSSGTGEQQIILQTSNEEMPTNTDILASALIDDVLQIETSQGVQLVNTVSTGVVSEETLGPAFQPLTPPVTAQTSETNALLTQPPIMSTLEVPSNKKKQTSKQLDNNAILLNTITGTTACGNNVINNNTIGSNRNNTNINNNSNNINSSERILTTPQNLEDCIAFIGVSTQSSTVPSSLELPITVTNPAIAPPKTSAPLGGLFNTKNLIVESSQISPQLVSSISSDPELQLELFTTSSASSSSIGNNSTNNINNNIIKGNRSNNNNNRNNNDGNVGDNVVACNIEIEKFNQSSKQQDVVCAESGLNDFTNQSAIGSLSFEDPNR